MSHGRDESSAYCPVQTPVLAKVSLIPYSAYLYLNCDYDYCPRMKRFRIK